MADPVNLNRFRKRKARERAEQEAAANRVKHGRTGAQKENDRRAEARRRALLDGAKREEP
ncbi:MAG TPA: DUF4169 family protein [Acetobacteraceae bacterium]|nr:DUF4169 family protein [Acetobacteraceae bacterium]